MPHELKADAVCPNCGKDVLGVAWTWRPNGHAVADFLHGPGTEECQRVFSWESAEAWREQNGRTSQPAKGEG